MSGESGLKAPQRSATRPSLSVEALSYQYPNGTGKTLDDVSLDIEAGEFVLLAGRSGSGKTSLLRAACGLVPHFHGGVLSGSVRVAGRDTAECGPGELADVVGYVAQDPETQVISTTVSAELDLPLRFRGDQPAERARAVEEVALALNIPHLLPRSVNTLSGGELQRVALAAALVTRPPLVLLDEPTSQLDPVAGDELVWLLRRLNEEWGVAVLLAEHRIERCLAAADRVIALESGRVALDGSPAAFLDYAVGDQPALATPAALMFAGAGIKPLPAGVRDAHTILRQKGIDIDSARRSGSGKPPSTRRPGSEEQIALSVRGLWVELDSGEGPVDVLREIDLCLARGERVALMGRNGAGKSTLLRTAAGLVEPLRGRADAPGGMALLTQSPADFLVREKIGDELTGPMGKAALSAVGLDLDPDRDPRDLSGGQRQRLALAIALAGRMEGDELPGLIALDEPTRGMDRGLKDNLSQLMRRLSDRGAGVLVCTHDVEFAVTFADRVILFGDGEKIADAAAGVVLSGGWYFASEVARVLNRPDLVGIEEGSRWLIGESTGRQPG